MKNNIIQILKNIYISFLAMLLFTGCEDFVEIDPPRDEVVSESVFSSDETAITALIGVYTEMILDGPFDGALVEYSSLTADEMEYASSNRFGSYAQFQFNDIQPDSNGFIASLWQRSYQIIFNANAIIEGLTNNVSITPQTRDLLLGEAQFIRAYTHFYLVNTYGDIPYINTTNVDTNSRASREPVNEVYQKIINDLKDAQLLLPEDYTSSEGRRTRANRFAVTALLARVYLYLEQWENAENEAAKVINEGGLFTLETDLNQVFLATSNETIFQLATVNVALLEGITPIGDVFVLNAEPANSFGRFTMKSTLAGAFEANDKRRTDWVGTFTSGENSWQHPHKYKNYIIFTPGPPENTVLMRLAEQYLIRAEARAHLGNIPGAQQDLNRIRNRAGLGNTTAADQTSLLEAIFKERRVELFTESNHRWRDLIRTGRVNEVIGDLKDTWQPTDALFPLPEQELLRNNNLTQNPGY